MKQFRFGKWLILDEEALKAHRLVFYRRGREEAEKTQKKKRDALLNAMPIIPNYLELFVKKLGADSMVVTEQMTGNRNIEMSFYITKGSK